MLVGASEGIPDQGLYSKTSKLLTASLTAADLSSIGTGTTVPLLVVILYGFYRSIRQCYTVILTPPESVM